MTIADYIKNNPNKTFDLESYYTLDFVDPDCNTELKENVKWVLENGNDDVYLLEIVMRSYYLSTIEDWLGSGL